MERQFLVDRHWLAERFKQRLRTPLAASPGRQRAPVRHLGVDWWRRLGRRCQHVLGKRGSRHPERLGAVDLLGVISILASKASRCPERSRSLVMEARPTFGGPDITRYQRRFVACRLGINLRAVSLGWDVELEHLSKVFPTHDTAKRPIPEPMRPISARRSSSARAANEGRG
jgi:hypothetical protein